MSERIPYRSPLAEALFKFTSNDTNFRLNRAANLLNARVEVDDSRWVSKTKRNSDGPNVITIGGAALPTEVAERWGLENTSADEQLLFKIAHELAHQFQEEKGYEKALTIWLDGENEIASEHIPYLELYAALCESGRVTGLSTEGIYQAQNTNTGRLRMEVLEDMTELIAAYFLGDEYFTQKISRSLSKLTQKKADLITTKIIEVCHELH